MTISKTAATRKDIQQPKFREKKTNYKPMTIKIPE